MQGFENARNIRIKPAVLRGRVTVPTGKSRAIRLIFCAALSEGESRLRGIDLSEDVAAALRCASALGAEWHRDGGDIIITGRRNAPTGSFDCGESATVLRFAIPAALALCGGGTFTGRGRLMARPLEPYTEAFGELISEWRTEGDSLTVRGTLESGAYEMRGDVSSQFVSGLMLALPLAGGGSIGMKGELQSGGYADMTASVMRGAGVSVTKNGGGYSVSGGYRAFDAVNDGDWSQAAFWYAADFLGAEVGISGLDSASEQPDRIVTELLDMMKREGNVTIDLRNNPDLLPPLAAAAAVRKGVCRFTGCERLKYKESDRLTKTAEILSTLGAEARLCGTELVIRGKDRLNGGSADCTGDHRLCMMAAVAATVCKESVTIYGAESVKKSYPEFFGHYTLLGGENCVDILREKT